MNKQKQPTKLVISLTQGESKAEVVTNEELWTGYFEHQLGIMPYEQDADGMRHYMIPTHMLRLFGKGTADNWQNWAFDAWM